jgi:proton-coupled amino acid transporter
MKTLSPFSLIADIANLFGLSAVLIQDFEFYQHTDTIRAMNTGGLLYVISIALYSLEGVALVLPLETSCADRKNFPSLLIQVLCGITILMVSFGTAGYFAFGDATAAPITLNLQGEWASFVKLALCLALYLTYPIMMFPVSDVLETSLGIASTSKPHQPHAWSVSSVVLRASVVACTTLVAYAVPDFGKFLGLVGSSICTILGFILPCYFHLRLFKAKLGWLEWFMDVGLIAFGVVFGIMGTIESVQKLFED